MNYGIINWLIGLLFVLAFVLWWAKPHIVMYARKLKNNKQQRKRESRQPASEKTSAKVSANASLKEQQEPHLAVLHVESSGDDEFIGKDVLDYLKNAGLEKGDMNMYQRFIEYSGEIKLVFNVINGVDPGTLSDEFATSSTPCITMFFDVGQSYNPVKCLKQMFDLAEEFAQNFGGQVHDAKHSALTEQTKQHMIGVIERRSLRKF